MKTIYRSMWILGLGWILTGTIGAQSTASPPQTPVAIENTNSAFAPSSVEVPEASPARPTVTSPAHIPPTGYLQFEQGFNQANDSPAGTNAQFGLVQTTKIALTTRLMVQFLSQPYTYNRVAGSGASEVTSNDPGDLQLGLQGIVHEAVGIRPVVALGYIRRVRAGTSANLDVGSYSQSALLLLSGDAKGGYHYDFNFVANEQNNGPVRRAQFAQTLSISRPVFEKATAGKLSGAVELSHFSQPFVVSSVSGNPVPRANSVNLLFAAGYSVRPNLVLDADFEPGLTSTSTRWQGAFGFTYLLPHRLWKDRHPVPVSVRHNPR